MCVKLHYYKMCNNTQKKKAAGAGKDFTLFFGVMLHFNFKCVYLDSWGMIEINASANYWKY